MAVYTKPSDRNFVAAVADDYEDLTFHIFPNEFDSAKAAIAKGFAGYLAVGIALGRAIIIGRAKPSLERFAEMERKELEALLSRMEIGTLSRRDWQFLEEAKDPEAMAKLESWRGMIESILI
jgi:hypothetical protein